MGETEILGKLSKELYLDKWWQDLLGQKVGKDLDLDLVEERLPRSEILAAEEIHRKFGNTLSYTEARKLWYLWDGIIHVPCDGEGVAVKIVKLYYKAVKKTLEFVQEEINVQANKMEASGVTDAKKNADTIRKTYDTIFKKHREFRDRLSTDAGISAMVRMMRTECDVPADYFDNDQRWFVAKNLVIDLDELRNNHQFVFLNHDAARPVTKYFDAMYEPNTNLGHWDRFLETSIPNAVMREYLQKVIGAAFMGESKLRCIINLHGPPGSGKSMLINTMFQLGKEGAGYAAMPDSRAITKVSGQNFEQDNFKGRRFNGISEPSSTEQIDDDFLKKYTGDIWVETRTLNVKSSGWVPQGVIFVASNKPLRINTRDKAIVERVQMIEFPVEFSKDAEDPAKRLVAGLEELLLNDRVRILEWIMQGMRKFIVEEGRKLTPPEDVKALSENIIVEGSTALRWVQDYIEEGLLEIDETANEDYWITIPDAFLRYNMWAAFNGEKKPLTKRFFTQDIENKYFGRTTGKHAKFVGIVPTIEYRRKYEAPAADSIMSSSGISF